MTCQTFTGTSSVKIRICSCRTCRFRGNPGDGVESCGVHEPGVAESYDRLSDLKLEGQDFTCFRQVSFTRCRNLQFRHCIFHSLYLRDVDQVWLTGCIFKESDMPGVYLDKATGVVVQGNFFRKVSSGVYAHNSRRVGVYNNRGINMLGPLPRGQLVQFDKVEGEGNAIIGNVVRNYWGENGVEDAISLYCCHGTHDSPIRVEGNWVLGDPVRGSEDFSSTGSAIMLGDGGGSNQICAYNFVRNAAQVGIGVAGGGDIAVVGNRVEGRASNVSNVGIYCWNQYPEEISGKIRIRENRVSWVDSGGRQNDYWLGGGFSGVEFAPESGR